MHKGIKDIFDEEKVLAEAAKRYGFKKEEITFLADAENYVYEFFKNQEAYILKITHSIRRSPDYMMGEIEWLNYLAAGRLSVAKAVSSLSGNFIEEVSDGEGGTFLLKVYEKAPGRKVNEADWNEKLFYALGEYMGQMHKITKSYKLDNPAYKRQEWYEEEQLKLRKYVPSDQLIVFQRLDDLMGKFHQLPKDENSYGLIHADLHHGNFHWDDGRITTFDFDDIGYNWFINDISILLYNVLWYPVIQYQDKTEFTGWFMRHFLEGYTKVNCFDSVWLQYIPDFLRLRHMLIYGLLHQAFDLPTIGEEEQRMLHKFRNEIENRTPITDYDFTMLSLKK